MQKKLLRFVSICLLAVAMLSTVAFAVTEASEYILITNVSVTRQANGVLVFDSTVTATGDFPDVGIDWIEIRTEDGDPLVRHSYKDPGYSYMMGHNKCTHTASFTYQGTVGEKYYAVVCFYAGQLGVAGDGHTMTSTYVTARK